MKRANPYMKVLTMLAGLTLVAALMACDNSPTPVVSSVPPRGMSMPNLTDAKRLSDGASKLTEAMKKPTGSFHFSFKGQENLSEDRTQPPQVGPENLQADVSPEEINLTETRGLNTRTLKAKWGDEMNRDMANLTTLGVMANPTLVIAVGASVAPPPSTDLVGTTLADKFTFDTTTATPSQKMGLQRARMVVTTIKDCKGTAWIATASGLLIKFNIDANFLDKNGHAWAEHYEGEVTPK